MQKQNKILFTRLTFTLVFITQFSFAQMNVSGVTIPTSLNYAQANPMQFYGAGTRKFLWLDMYVGVIFLNEKSLTPNQIINSNKPMALRLHIISSLISRKRTIKAIEDGFDKTTNGNAVQYQDRIDKMISFFKSEIEPNDIIDLVYFPTQEIKIYKNETYLGSLYGLDFKQVLFGMWLSENAVDKKMRSELLNKT